MKLNVIYLSMKEECSKTGYYDHGLLNEYLLPQFDCEYHEVDTIPEDLRGGVVVIPARMQADIVPQLNNELAKLEWAVVILTGDEESVFPWRELRHSRMLVWVMSPRQGVHDDAEYRIGSGYRMEAPELLKQIGLQDRTLDFFFAGQVTHPKREQCASQLRNMPNGKLVETKGFAQGMGYQEYLTYMAQAKFVPCPSGPATPDTFRLYEALEAGCVPIGDSGGYWPYLFGEEVPFPIVSDWSVLPTLMPELLKEWPHNSNRVFSWWQSKKRKMADRLEGNIATLSGEKPTRKGDEITAIIPTCPIPSAPSTEVIDETITSIRENLPDSEIIVMFDGVKPELAERKPAYDEYTRRLLWRIKNEYTNVIPILFEQHNHQSLMTKEVLKLIRTPLLLFMEHDTPFTGEIPWEDIKEVVKSGYAHVVRFHHETHILAEHQYLQLDKHPQDVMGVPLIRSRQWSQRPSLIEAEFYRRIADKYFDDQPRFIEHVMYGPLIQNDWAEFRYHIYAPQGSILRSLHRDGARYIGAEE